MIASTTTRLSRRTTALSGARVIFSAVLRSSFHQGRDTTITTAPSAYSTSAKRRDVYTFILPSKISTPRGFATRCLSTEASTTASSKDNATHAPIRDFFLDNLGKVFLTAIALVIASLVRSSYGTSNMKAVREQLEIDASIDPLEIDELRQANSELTPELFRTIVHHVYAAAHEKGGRMTYPDFVRQVRTVLVKEKGEGCTIGMGHLLDRVVIAAFENKLNNSKESENKNSGNSGDITSFSSDDFASPMSEKDNEVSMPLSFWLTVLSLALNGPVSERIRILYEVMEKQSTTSTNNSNSDDSQQRYDLSATNNSSSDDNAPSVTLQDITTMVHYLQETCQLVPDTQVVPTETKYPTQQYRRGTPQELVRWGDDKDHAISSSNEECLDLEAFTGILRSKSVCAWGECYHRKKKN